ncbi:hypothetical protein DPEC_G00233190 [Dallia pectoralis]|uniref:Uncharacterized protein n=1 Tax=Dallia pectoralis TaxID=75939 RepID=A0ACC2FXN7_DALPE|nr:hypothetical protein DPEC_G00233190 [Dallia pectoralis]
MNSDQREHVSIETGIDISKVSECPALMVLPGHPQRLGILWSSCSSEETTAGTENAIPECNIHTEEIIAGLFRAKR